MVDPFKGQGKGGTRFDQMSFRVSQLRRIMRL